MDDSSRRDAIDRLQRDLQTERKAADHLRQLQRRLEVLDELLPTLAGVLDIRDVFERVSAIAQNVIPHDALVLPRLSEDKTQIVAYALTDKTGRFPLTADVSEARREWLASKWEYLLQPDMQGDPAERDMPPARAGYRARLLVPIRLHGERLGSLDFLSLQPDVYTHADVLVAKRIADHVALALSHGRLADEVRRHDALQARTTNLELLDALLGALVDRGDLSAVFGRISEIAERVLSHDAAALTVYLPDGLRARVYANRGFPVPLPEVIDLPDDLREDPNREHDIFDDLSLRTEERYRRLHGMGFQSLLRVPIRLDDRAAGALIFLSKQPASFRQADVLVAHRVADRAAVMLARDREVAASRRADEATERAARLEARVRALTDELDARTGYRRVVGESAEWRQVLTQAAQVAATDTTVLLLGESGTGKEVIARFLHRASVRSGGPFIALNCAALPEQLLEAELFGYERGAFTGAMQSKPGQLEQAAGGTLFLDEVAEMSPSAQAKFLRVLQEREFQRLGGTRILRTDARVVAATNRDLPRAIAQGQFREDLYYRLNVFAIRLPALRDRRDDILPLSEAFIAEIGRGLGRPPAGVSRDARQRLMEYPWPGNVRELRNLLERAAILCDGGLITAEHLALTPVTVVHPARLSPAAAIEAAAPPVSVPAAPARPSSADDLHAMERAMIDQALQDARFNKSKAAKALGLTRHQLYIRMRRHGLE
jgi:transcriptional regulator with GAF, ATPase, and Fis domain